MEAGQKIMTSAIFPPIPLDTANAARAVFGSSNYYLVIGDQVDILFKDLAFQSRSTASKRELHRLATLYLITIFQHIESLPDQLAVDALRERIDWKYALHSPLKPFPIAQSSLCEFRMMVSFDPESKQDIQDLMNRLVEIPQVSLCKCLLMQTDQVIANVCRITRLLTISEAMNHLLETLATIDHDWLRSHSLPYWYERYGYLRRNHYQRNDRQEQDDLAQAIGSDGFYLLEAIECAGSKGMMNLPEVFVLRKVLDVQFERVMGKAVWRKEGCAGCPISGRG